MYVKIKVYHQGNLIFLFLTLVDVDLTGITAIIFIYYIIVLYMIALNKLKKINLYIFFFLVRYYYYYY